MRNLIVPFLWIFVSVVPTVALGSGPALICANNSCGQPALDILNNFLAGQAMADSNFEGVYSGKCVRHTSREAGNDYALAFFIRNKEKTFYAGDFQFSTDGQNPFESLLPENAYSYLGSLNRHFHRVREEQNFAQVIDYSLANTPIYWFRQDRENQNKIYCLSWYGERNKVFCELHKHIEEAEL